MSKKLTRAQSAMLWKAMQPDGYVVYGDREAKTARILIGRGLIVAPNGLNEWSFCKVFATVERSALETLE